MDDEIKDNKIELYFNGFNDNIAFTQAEHKDVIHMLKKFLAKIIRDSKDLDARKIDAINKMYMTLITSIESYNNNNMSLINKLMELNSILNPMVTNEQSADDKEIADFMAKAEADIKKNNEMFLDATNDADVKKTNKEINKETNDISIDVNEDKNE